MTPIALSLLEPRFICFETRTETVEGQPRTVEYTRRAASLASAQGLFFLCPVCYQKNNGPVGTHGVQVAFHGRGVEPHQGSVGANGQPTRWHVSGTDLLDLTLSPSIDLSAGGGCSWHGWIQQGLVT